MYFQYDSVEQLRDLLQRHIAGTMAELHVRAGNGNKLSAQESTQEEQIAQYRSQVDSFIRALEGEWASFGDNHGVAAIEEAKAILAGGLEHVLGLRSQIVTGLTPVTAILDDVAQQMRTLRRHQLMIDGGRSAREFWKGCDAIISRLKESPPMLSDNTNGGA